MSLARRAPNRSAKDGKRRVEYQTIGYRILSAGDLFSDQSVASEASGEGARNFLRLRRIMGIFQRPISGWASLAGSTRSPTRRPCPQLSVSAGRFGRHSHWRESGAPRASAPFAGFLSVGHFAAHERKFSRHFKRIFWGPRSLSITSGAAVQRGEF
jgi:hypothetical protein